jgi:hypothetical protein
MPSTASNSTLPATMPWRRQSIPSVRHLVARPRHFPSFLVFLSQPMFPRSHSSAIGLQFACTTLKRGGATPASTRRTTTLRPSPRSVAAERTCAVMKSVSYPIVTFPHYNPTPQQLANVQIGRQAVRKHMQGGRRQIVGHRQWPLRAVV